jgi:hypothetical protein
MSRRRTVARHLRRYPWWYGIAAVWLTAILALPIVRLSPLEVLSRQATTGDLPAPAGNPSPSTVALPPGRGAAPLAGGGTGGGPTTALTVVTPDGPTTTTATTGPGALDLVSPEVLDLVFDAIPQIVLPPLPDELAPLARAIAPIAATGCSGLGLASVVVAVVAQSANGVPVQRLLPYLTPVSTACAAFPVAAHHTVCAADPPFVIDLGGLASTPPILGLGIDEVEATQTLLAQTFGQPMPDLAASLRTQLDCKVV